MATIKAIYIITSDNKLLFSRKFPTVENKQKKELEKDYTPFPSDKIISYLFYNQIIKEDLLQEEFKRTKYEEKMEIDQQKLNKLINVVDFDINLHNFNHFSECPIVSLNLNQLQKMNCNTNNFDNDSKRNNCNNINGTNNKIESNDNNLNISDNDKINSEDLKISGFLWPCVYVKRYQLYCFAFPKIDIRKINQIRNEVLNEINKNKISSKSSMTNSDLIFRIKKLYEGQDISIIGSFSLIENLLNHIITTKQFEENKLHVLISNMAPFGNILETNINFMIDGLNFLNQRFINNNSLFSKTFINKQNKNIITNNDSYSEKMKIPGWVPNIHSNSSERLRLTLKEELRYVQFPQKKQIGIILSEILCQAQLSQNCEITLPLKEKNTKYLKNMRIHPCSKFQNQTAFNNTINNNINNNNPIIQTNTINSTRIIFTPPQEEFKMAVFEVENFNHDLLPITGRFDLKEFSDNEIKFYLELHIDFKVLGKFEYFHISIPLAHLGKITKTDMMAQVGEVNLINNDTTLHWDLENKVIDSPIVLSGGVNYKKNNKTKNRLLNNGAGNLDKKYEDEIISEVNEYFLNNYSEYSGNSNYNCNYNNNTFNISNNSNANNNHNINSNITSYSNANSNSNSHSQNNKTVINKNINDVINDKSFNVEEMIKNHPNNYFSSDIMSTNCFCKISFKLSNYTFSNLEIDKSGLLFYPKLTPKIEIKKEFISNDYIIWNGLSFMQYDVSSNNRNNNDDRIMLQEINIEEKEENSYNNINNNNNFNHCNNNTGYGGFGGSDNNFKENRHESNNWNNRDNSNINNDNIFNSVVNSKIKNNK